MQRVQALAQHGFQRVFPAGFDVDRLPQPLRVRQSPRIEPPFDVLAVADLRLQRRQRVSARGEIREALARLLPRVRRLALPILQRLHCALQLRLRSAGCSARSAVS